MKEPFYLVIEGVIGVGKTTLARLLQPKLGGSLLLEVFEENPFLARFYQDRERYAFSAQIFFLLSRYQQQRDQVPALLAGGKGLISDYSFEKDLIFAGINLKGDELELYHGLFEALAEKIPQPDLIVYLRASTDALLQRITQRDRSYERGMEADYIDILRRGYDQRFMATEHKPPVLAIDTDDLDFVRRPSELEEIAARIQAALVQGASPA